MNAKSISKVLAMTLAIIMLVGMIPMNAFAASVDYTAHDDYYKLISKKDWELAPGITESEIVLNNEAGTHRQVAHVVEIDVSNPYAKVIPSTYKMAEGLENKEYSVQVMSQQAAYAEANGYGNVVAAMNIALSWYNDAYYAEHGDLIGEPLGYLVLDGQMYTNSQGQNKGAQTCLVINFDEKDGVARPADIPKTQVRSTADAITGWEEQVIPANFGFLVKDGVNQYAANHTSDPASRSFMGIKADGTIVIVMNDGRQSPYSAGFNSYEMAEFMLSLGCVQAVNGDGGGSSAFLSQRPGEELELHCSPSDGAERPTTHGILVISTAPATGEFARATISTDNTYYTPGSSVQFNALGTDLVGNKADIPADVTWQLTDSTMGTIENGLFVSSGKLGEVTAQMVWNNEVVGEATIEIVIPEYSFKQDTLVLPYGETVELSLNVTTNNGLSEVTTKAGDIVYTLSDANMGTISGNSFTTTTDTTVTGGTITAVFCGDTENAISATIKFGKASEVVYDYEDGQLLVDTDPEVAPAEGEPYGWFIRDTRANGYFAYRFFAKKNYTPVGMDIPAKVYLVNSDTGMVRNGNYAMGVDIDWTNVTASCHGQMDIFLPESLDLTDATSVGLWLYIPADLVTASMQYRAGFGTKDGSYTTVNGNIKDILGETSGVGNGGWIYISWPVLDTYKSFEYFQINSHYTAGTGAYNYYQDVTFYIDDVTVDYSDATIDRDNPYFTGVTISSDDVEKEVTNGYTVSGNVVTLFAQAQENTTKNNFTGLKASSAKVTIDGQVVTKGVSVSASGKVTLVDQYLSDGVHTIEFEIADNQGNVGNIVRKLVVNSEQSAVRLEVPAASGLLPTGSIYWLNLVADDLASIDSVTTTINLDYVNDWELEGMEVAYGFEAEYYINNHNDAVITFTRTGTAVADTTVLAKLPVRIWMAKGWMDDSGVRADYISDLPTMQDKYYILTPHAMWYSDGTRDYKLVVSAEAGVVEYLDGSTETFSAKETVIQTEMNRYYTNSDRQGKWSFHICTPGTAQSKAATCTTAGYTDRVFCVGCACGSVENLGAECDTHAGCGSVIDWGTVVPATGHNYEVVDGQLVCQCGEVCTENGLLDINGVAYYAAGGKLVSGWVMVEEDWYYFDKTTFAGLDGEKTADSHIQYVFDKGRLTVGVWETTDAGIRYWYGPKYYRDTTNAVNGAKPFEIDGKTYLFDKQGYMQTGIAYYFTGDFEGGTTYYDCGTDGVAKLLTGPYNNYFYIDGLQVMTYKLVEFEGNYYYVSDGRKLAMNVKLYLNKALEGTGLAAGYYEFDAEGKMILEEEDPETPEDGTLNGVVGDYFYINGEKQLAYKLVQFEGSYYYVSDGHKVAKSTKLYLNKALEGTGLAKGYYEFDAEGKMIIPEEPPVEETKNGVVDGFLYINGEKQLAYKLVQFEGNYYYVSDGHKVAKSTKLYLNKALEGTGLAKGYYEFDADGKMIIPEEPPVEETKNGVIGDFLYINGEKQLAYQLVEFEGSYYYVSDGHKIAKNTRLYLNKALEGKTLSDGTPMKKGYYEFDAEGKMILKNGPVDGFFYINGVKQLAYQLVQFEGNYYYVSDGHKLATSTRLFLNKALEGTGLATGYYEFDADGKMIIE